MPRAKGRRRGRGPPAPPPRPPGEEKGQAEAAGPGAEGGQDGEGKGEAGGVADGLEEAQAEVARLEAALEGARARVARLQYRPWAALPPLALELVARRLDLQHRLQYRERLERFGDPLAEEERALHAADAGDAGDAGKPATSVGLLPFVLTCKGWHRLAQRVWPEGGVDRVVDVVLSGRVQLVRWALGWMPRDTGTDDCRTFAGRNFRRKVDDDVLGPPPSAWRARRRIDLACMAAWNGDVEMLKVLLTEYNLFFKVGPELFAWAATGGSLPVLDFLREQVGPARVGAMLKDCSWDWTTWAAAAREAHMEVLEYCRRHRCPTRPESRWFYDDTTPSAFAQAAGGASPEHLAVLKWAWPIDEFKAIDEMCMVRAAGSGYFPILAWVAQHLSGAEMGVVDVDFPGLGENVCAEAARFGHLEVLRWLRGSGVEEEAWQTGDDPTDDPQEVEALEERWGPGPTCPWDETTCVNAARYGRLEVLRYAVRQGCPCGEDVTAAAAKGGHLDVLQYLRLECTPPCPWDGSTLEAAAGRGDRRGQAVVRWARMHGCDYYDDGGPGVGHSPIDGEADGLAVHNHNLMLAQQEQQQQQQQQQQAPPAAGTTPGPPTDRSGSGGAAAGASVSSESDAHNAAPPPRAGEADEEGWTCLRCTLINEVVDGEELARRRTDAETTVGRRD